MTPLTLRSSPSDVFLRKDVASNFIEITLRHWCSPVNLLYIFRTPSGKDTSGWLLLNLKSTIFTAFNKKRTRGDFPGDILEYIFQ